MLALTKKRLILFLILGAWNGIFAVDIPKHNNKLVHDFSKNFISQEQVHSLEQSAQKIRDTAHLVISIVVESNPQIQDVFGRSLLLARSWGIGDPEQNNGVLIYIHSHHRRLFIQTGKGVEGFLPDAIVNRLIQELLEPGFKAGQPYDVLQRTLAFMASAGNQEFEPYQDGAVPPESWVSLLIILLIVFLLIKSRKGGRPGRGYRSAPYFPGPFMGGGSMGGGFGGGAGSWGGFGGGGFGGGGAGGRW